MASQNSQDAERILGQLKEIEQTEGVRILYACESGSRAWGFESADSDFDVRFLYIHPTEWYLSIQRRPDTIERSTDPDLDLVGWDLPKALKLLRKSNPPLLEWLQSPIVYVSNSGFLERMRDLIPDYYSPVACMYHYLHMAQGNFREYLRGDPIWTKKYFYVLRPVLACQWIEHDLGPVPVRFETLVDRLIADIPLRREIEGLVQAKRSGQELDEGPRNPLISEFLEQELERLRCELQPPSRTQDPSHLDRLLLDMLRETHGSWQ